MSSIASPTFGAARLVPRARRRAQAALVLAGPRRRLDVLVEPPRTGVTRMVAGRHQPDPPPTIALLSWNTVLEDFLDPLGVSLEDFCRDFSGSWLFGYAAALETAGVRTVIICTSKRVKEASHFTHGPTGARIWILPTPRIYGALHGRMAYPYGQTVREAFGEIRGGRRLLLPLYAFVREVALYLATPLSSLAQVLRREG